MKKIFVTVLFLMHLQSEAFSLTFMLNCISENSIKINKDKFILSSNPKKITKVYSQYIIINKQGKKFPRDPLINLKEDYKLFKKDDAFYYFYMPRKKKYISYNYIQIQKHNSNSDILIPYETIVLNRFDYSLVNTIYTWKFNPRDTNNPFLDIGPLKLKIEDYKKRYDKKNFDILVYNYDCKRQKSKF